MIRVPSGLKDRFSGERKPRRVLSGRRQQDVKPGFDIEPGAPWEIRTRPFLENSRSRTTLRLSKSAMRLPVSRSQTEISELSIETGWTVARYFPLALNATGLSY